MSYRFTYRPYRRKFIRPLRTALGEWREREGFILRIEAESGAIGYGEVAPIPEFGSESLDVAREYLEGLASGNSLIGAEQVPCCAFAVSSALQQIAEPEVELGVMELAGLLPAGLGALAVAERRVADGYDTLKWKIGVESVAMEQAVFERMDQSLPQGVRIRLDANGSWDLNTWCRWQDFLCERRERLDYVEQPLPVGEEMVMGELMRASGLPIALDESLQGQAGRELLRSGEWSGPLVVKPALMGDLQVLADELAPVAEQVVLSSVFETRVGLMAARALLACLPLCQRAHGFDTGNMFSDVLSWESQSVSIQGPATTDTFEQVWHSLPFPSN
ncbi:o-succinylbenzoate synthase [Coraliomargarita akajimensis]|uniref:o-succinylbenzoate synthase n=1 Tax=Coraliomargarita akajimensis (strain DSM 45221 / IAM 15411 / JCM 23193 / KCTC 12865 / 04OKA010-24) TaxID=583355 RepID=D5EKE4_CORAD|nr:o-succinylbenzoate synthase [Coraliomargarita akajimensis]ADE54893.1 o-succinylbenzoic acid (OSB) synthetase [Coraliomargarita akajimensis DSM 45221]